MTEKLQVFSTSCQSRIGEFEVLLKELESKYEELGQYFAEEKKVTSDKFYEKLLKFKNSCRAAK